MKYWATVIIPVEYSTGLYDEDYIEADNEDEAKIIAIQSAIDSITIQNAELKDEDAVAFVALDGNDDGETVRVGVSYE